MRGLVVVAMLAVGCGGVAPQSSQEACDWCPGAPETTLATYPDGTVMTCLCPDADGRSMMFFVDPLAVTCEHAQCIFAFYCSPAVGVVDPNCPL